MTSVKPLHFLAAACLLLTGCPGGSGSGSLNTAPSGTIVYLADQETDTVFELYLVSSGARLNPKLPLGRTVTSFALTPDKTAVLYIADQDTNDVFELYRVNIATPGVSTKLNGTLIPPQGDVASFSVTPDGSSVVYLADQQIDQAFQLYRVPFSTPGSSTVLNSALPSGGTVSQFAVTLDSTKVVYIANQGNINIDELYQVAFSNPGNSQQLNTPLSLGRNVVQFAISPNSVFVVYLADQDIDEVFELYLAQVSGPANGVRLNPPLLPGQNVTTFAVTPDSTAVIYRANEDNQTVFELYRVAFAFPQTSMVKLNGPLTPGGNVSSFTIAANGLAVVYSATQDNAAVVELYYVLQSQPGTSQKINPNGYAAGQNVTNFAITPDSSAAVYMANQTNVSAVQLYRVLFSSLQLSSPPLNGALVSGGNVASFSVTPDSANILYRADQTTFGVVELYGINVGSPGASSTLNGQLVAGGDVTAFTF